MLSLKHLAKALLGAPAILGAQSCGSSSNATGVQPQPPIQAASLSSNVSKEASSGASAKPSPASSSATKRPAPLPPDIDRAYARAIKETEAMVRDGEAQREAKSHGLQILNVTWEDTGRFKGSSVGPNISDMTIQVGRLDPKSEKFSVAAMPVIRFPNFEDKSADLSPRDFTLLVGNQSGTGLKRISLHDFLAEPRRYLSNPSSWKGERSSLLAPRDEQVLVSAQACFLPVPKAGKATFNPVLFNYQGRKGDPAVLAVLATREGTSATVIDNARDAFPSGGVWGQRLFHNANGQRASLTGERESEFRAKNPGSGPSPSVGSEAKDKAEGGLSMVLLIQIPLKQKAPPMNQMMDMAAPMAASPSAGVVRRRSDVENAVIGSGPAEGPFTEIDNLDIERDERYPVRVTVQFYKATSNGAVSGADMSQVAAQLNRVYSQSDYVGSLVTGGETGRATEYDGLKVQPADWWEQFWKHHQKETGDTREEALAKLRELLGPNFQDAPVSELMLRDSLRA